MNCKWKNNSLNHPTSLVNTACEPYRTTVERKRKCKLSRKKMKNVSSTLQTESRNVQNTFVIHPIVAHTK